MTIRIMIRVVLYHYIARMRSYIFPVIRHNGGALSGYVSFC